MALLSLRNVGFDYGADEILRAVDLEIEKGERLAVVGPNGGGKSTLAKLLLDVLEPSRGRITWHDPEIRRLRGYVPQFPHFDRHFPLRVREVVESGRLRTRRLGRGLTVQDRAKVESLLERLELKDLADAYLAELSGGELKRVLLARAWAGEPLFLVLDEPSASLDERSRHLLWHLIDELPAETTVAWITHDLEDEAPRFKRRLVVDGQVRELEAAAPGWHGHPHLCEFASPHPPPEENQP